MSYSYSKVSELEKLAMVGNHQCLTQVRKFAGAPAAHLRLGDNADAFFVIE